MELTVEGFLDQSLEVSKQENVPHLMVILFNVKHLESSVKAARGIISELRVAIPLFEAEIRPLKLQLKELARQPATSANGATMSVLAKRLNILRGLITQAQVDLNNFRQSCKADRAALAIIVEALREYYRQNPEQPEDQPAPEAPQEGA